LDVSTERVAGTPIADERGVAVYGQRGDDAEGETGLAERSTHDLQNFARRHPLRVAILALLSSKRHPERTVDELCDSLPNKPRRAVVEYHLKALRAINLVSEEREAGAPASYSLA
jgi:DNA-binding transcriptional ArsR family regulator